MKQLNTLLGEATSARRASLSKFQVFSGLTENIPVFSLLFWTVLVLPRVVTLGFYDGDWFDIAVPRDLDHYLVPFSSRPVVLPVYVFLNEVIGFRAWIWQLILAMLVLACAMCLYRLLRAICHLAEAPKSAPEKHYSLSSDLAVVCWLAFPWNLGWSAWPTLIMGGIALLFFLLFCLSFINALFNEGSVGRPLLFYALSVFSYETFYFAFFLIGALLFVLLVSKKHARYRFWKLICLLSLIQVAAVLYNRFIAYLIPIGSSKPPNFMAFKQWPDAIGALPGNLAAALSGQASALVSTTEFMAVAAALLLTSALCVPKKRGSAACLFLFAALAFIGIGSSVLLYGLGYYGVIGVGTMSRTTLGISMWLTMLFFIFLRSALLWRSTVVGLMAFGTVGYVLFLLVPALSHQQEVWAKAWSESTRLMKSAPAQAISATPANATIVYVGPNTIESMTFAGTIELTAGIWLMHPSTTILTSTADRSRGPILPNTSGANTRFIVAKASYHKLTWDGRMLTMSLPGHWTSPIPAELVYEWDAYRSTFRKVNPGESFGEAPAF